MRTSLVLLALLAASASHGALSGRDVLKQHCYRCHGAAEPKADLDLTQTDAALREPRLRALILEEVGSDAMPKGATKLSAAEKLALRELLNGEPSSTPPPGTAAAPSGWAEEARKAIESDLARMPEPDRARTRYLVWPAPQPESKAATDFLLNSLSWSSALVTTQPVTPAVLRFELDDYGWSDATWTRIAQDSPYPSDGRWLRGDWFVYAASQAPLYYDILRVPVDRSGFELSLGINSVANIAQGTMMRAGFAESGVATYNRILERHASRHGAYWRSYDFNLNPAAFFTPKLREYKPLKNIFAHPLKAGEIGGNGFVHDGEEAIFHLPNGLFGYTVSNFAGVRLDAVPTAIAQDPTHYNRVVTTAISCFKCHGQGLRHHADEIRPNAERGLYGARTERVLRANRPPAEQKTVIEADNARYQAALAGLGGASAGAVERVFERYRAPLTPEQLAFELAISQSELERRTRCVAELAQLKNSLDRGRVARELVEQIWPLAAAAAPPNPPLPDCPS